MMKTLAAASVLAMTGAAFAQFDLQITEIWMGNEPGSNLTEDWFEVTNFGDTAYVAATDGQLYFDDESADFTTGDLLDIPTIAPGETVIFVDGDVVLWNDIWFTNLPAGTQVVSYAGAGLGQGGDTINLFLDADLNGLDGADAIIETAGYPDANFNGGQSYDVFLGAFSTVGNFAGAYQSSISNDVGQFAVASPGTIPTPGAVALLGLAGLAGVRRHRG
ncbi:MAG: hypothetical protein Tsb0013_10980 [Phycisphaerales bacterium]